MVQWFAQNNRIIYFSTVREFVSLDWVGIISLPWTFFIALNGQKGKFNFLSNLIMCKTYTKNQKCPFYNVQIASTFISTWNKVRNNLILTGQKFIFKRKKCLIGSCCHVTSHKEKDLRFYRLCQSSVSCGCGCVGKRIWIWLKWKDCW